MYVVIQTAYKPFYAALLLSDIQQIHVYSCIDMHKDCLYKLYRTALIQVHCNSGDRGMDTNVCGFESYPSVCLW